MAEQRPFEERPAARPAAAPASQPSNFQPVQPQKSGLGCLGWIGIIVAAIFVISVIASIVPDTNKTRNSSSSSSSQSSGASADPIEQARVVLGGAYSYEQVKSVTDAALSSAGLTVNDDNRSRAWSSALAATKDSTVNPMSVMQCAPELLNAASGLELPEAIALCYTEMALE